MQYHAGKQQFENQCKAIIKSSYQRREELASRPLRACLWTLCYMVLIICLLHDLAYIQRINFFALILSNIHDNKMDRLHVATMQLIANNLILSNV